MKWYAYTQCMVCLPHRFLCPRNVILVFPQGLGKTLQTIALIAYLTTVLKVNGVNFLPRHPLQSTTPPSSKYHATLFKVPHHPLQSITPPIKVPHRPLQGTIFYHCAES